MLESLGLDELTEKVYRLLPARQDLNIEAIAVELSVDIEHIRTAFDQLAELALLRPSWESPGGLRPVSPEAGLQLLLQRRQIELVRQQQITEAQTAIASLVDEYANRRPSTSQTGAGSLIGMAAIQARIEELATGARLEVASFMSHSAHDPRALEAAKPLDMQVRGRGVSIRTICLDSIRNDMTTLTYAQWLVQIGADVRTAPTPRADAGLRP
ncbi:hypothetical protein AB0J63_01805 [Streptosporangium canum]|uniref:hypothetical protein n=1 Tax=Streptosporangium canum TaxID=324952 RepID=UPI00343FA3F1